MCHKRYLWKSYFLNTLIEENDFRSYLELGIAKKETWNLIKCSWKIGVDSDPTVTGENIVNMTIIPFSDNTLKLLIKSCATAFL